MQNRFSNRSQCEISVCIKHVTEVYEIFLIYYIVAKSDRKSDQSHAYHSDIEANKYRINILQLSITPH